MAAVVIAGLDPAIHPVRKKLLTKGMDPRVKPAGDGTEVGGPHDAIRPVSLFYLEMTDLMQFYDGGPCAGR